MTYPGQPPNDPRHDPDGWSQAPYGRPYDPYAQGTPHPAGPYPQAHPYASAPGTQPYGAGYPGMDPWAPFGRDPITGLPFSDKSKVVAGLLQIFLGSLGVGRFYLGDFQTGGIQLGLTVIGWITAIFFVGFLVLLGVGIWALIDGIMMLTGSVRDKNGLPLRP
ncbi:TM2 domain-containing protein [Gordonia hankookensis]|uniref:TM2 domain-containing protein n=1 Tax=Gordonia hankookensis TaxID=589403 RepID=A0ABR7W7B7_9ACTN|nr:TM2 domain-containing protein [Gordonia hankookensis]MBD1318715.1 TM2 domain-containing protein [Gordonia hankookensis]